MFLLVAHFRPQDDTAEAGSEVEAGGDRAPGVGTLTGAEIEPTDDDLRAVALLAAQPTARWVRWAGSTEEAGHRVLVAEFASAADYRRALSPFDVRMTVVPWLSGAEITTSGVFEVRAAAGADAAGEGRPEAASAPLVLSEVTVTDPGR